MWLGLGLRLVLRWTAVTPGVVLWLGLGLTRTAAMPGLRGRRFEHWGNPFTHLQLAVCQAAQLRAVEGVQRTCGGCGVCQVRNGTARLACGLIS